MSRKTLGWNLCALRMILLGVTIIVAAVWLLVFTMHALTKRKVAVTEAPKHLISLLPDEVTLSVVPSHSMVRMAPDQQILLARYNPTEQYPSLHPEFTGWVEDVVKFSTDAPHQGLLVVGVPISTGPVPVLGQLWYIDPGMSWVVWLGENARAGWVERYSQHYTIRLPLRLMTAGEIAFQGALLINNEVKFTECVLMRVSS